jgi:hypothetical protein
MALVRLKPFSSDQVYLMVHDPKDIRPGKMCGVLWGCPNAVHHNATHHPHMKV